MMKYVIINADDFGISPSVNKGIIEAFQAGGITSTSLMVNMPGFEEAIHLARMHPGLGVGLHFNLTYGRPVSSPGKIPSLVRQDGSFHPVNSACTREESDIETELNAQWHRFLATGLRPTHVDSHHHIHQNFPAVFRAMSHLAVKENIPMRRSQTPHEDIHPSPLMTDHVLLDTYDKHDGLHQLLQYLHQLPEGTTEVMCHPGYIDDTLRNISVWIEPRKAEMTVFRDPMVKTTYEALGIQPIHFGMLSSIGLVDALGSLESTNPIDVPESLASLDFAAQQPPIAVRKRKRKPRLRALKSKRRGLRIVSLKKKATRLKSKSKLRTTRIKVKKTKKRATPINKVKPLLTFTRK
ncbi:carbohydrate deacetylase [Paenibacillus planticolens]|uniref:ChbG/HpnK family deacetylase n=1 Tax=Paenibacillus planticolens TaxID=2654976 RepID=A0ABX1ZTJ9_9BACL|nr:ChbG/HpnK family deacetylase [Paenibacillus planticolens]NOV02148.1 ChbG/HpnK family deacetylase [Paenibacillus planticolens]